LNETIRAEDSAECLLIEVFHYTFLGVCCWRIFRSNGLCHFALISDFNADRRKQLHDQLQSFSLSVEFIWALLFKQSLLLFKQSVTFCFQFRECRLENHFWISNNRIALSFAWKEKLTTFTKDKAMLLKITEALWKRESNVTKFRINSVAYIIARK